MLNPFSEFDWDLRYYRLDRNLEPIWDELVGLSRGASALVLVPEYFGNRLSITALDLLHELHGSGSRIVEDWTHSVISPRRAPVDMAIASLRKTLPVGDGAWAWGFSGGQSLLPKTSSPGTEMWAGMDLLALAGDQRDRALARKRIRRAESRFAVELEPAFATARTQVELMRLNFSSFGAARVRNARHLMRRLKGYEIVNHEIESDVPSHVVLRVKHPHALQRMLAQRNVYCPVHWERPAWLPETFPWDSLISIPIDHRYDEDDMTYVATTLNALHD
ncbi:hypothetical protein [Aeromicrobium phragmitis]|uniref:hypothetical protein n=1 Tax=Aeromicrobium phragmitis TaxID=2478914 RepID=UPI00105FDE56|nr:hypothetical protein [Aeromicrobium phragmitis]